MALAGSQSNRPRLPPVPQGLPRTQQEWDRLVNVFQQWRSAMLPKWITPTLQNGWVNYGGEYEPAGYYMDFTGRVYLRGLVKSGTTGGSTPIFTLPSQYVPPYTQLFSVIANDAMGEIRVGGVNDTGAWGGPGGVVLVVGTNAFAPLSGISFSTTP